MTNHPSHLTPVDASATCKDANLRSFMPGLVGEQLATFAENARTWFHNRESIRQIQQQAAHEAAAQHEVMSHKLREASCPSDFMDIQQDMSRYYQDAVGQYWQQIATTHLQTQMEMMAKANHFLSGKTGEQIKAMLNTFHLAMPADSQASHEKTQQSPIRLASGKVHNQ